MRGAIEWSNGGRVGYNAAQGSGRLTAPLSLRGTVPHAASVLHRHMARRESPASPSLKFECLRQPAQDHGLARAQGESGTTVPRSSP